jgi:hypothetical protein
MLPRQAHLLPRIAETLQKRSDSRINQLIREEISRNGLPPYSAEQYQKERLSLLMQYNDNFLLRLADELSIQLCERMILHAPFRDQRDRGNNHHQSKEDNDETDR